MSCIQGATNRGRKVQNVFSKTLSDLTEGEMLQMEKAFNSDTTQEDYIRIIYCKTASLFESAALSGAMSVDAPQEMVSAIGDFPRNIGIAFQIQDDILDVIGDSKELGKLTGSDEKDGKVTYVTMHGLKKAAGDVRRMSEEALSLYDSLTASNGFLRQLITELITRTK